MLYPMNINEMTTRFDTIVKYFLHLDAGFTHTCITYPGCTRINCTADWDIDCRFDKYVEVFEHIFHS